MFPQIFGKYVLEREIAGGGMAVVYLATLRGAGGFEKRLVVKQIRVELAHDEDFIRRFVEEAKTTVDLSHPNIVPVYELGVEQGVYYIAMELAKGVTLAELLSYSGPLSAAEGAHLGTEVCRALDYAHRKASIVHRDVTPRNVVIDEEGHVRLIDFGIAAPARDEAAGRKVFGSPGHMPPEQIRGGPLTAATDVFAVGALLLEAWTGKAPFRRRSSEASEQALAEAPAPLSTTIPELAGLDEVIATSLSLDPALRPQRAEDLARPLRAFLRGADTGDVARQLGERVRNVTARARTDRASRPPTLESQPAAASGRGATTGARQTPVTERLGSDPAAPVTLTFAAREQLLEWTRERPEPVPERPRETSEGDSRRRRRLVAASVTAAVAVAGILGVLATRGQKTETVASATSRSGQPRTNAAFERGASFPAARSSAAPEATDPASNISAPRENTPPPVASTPRPQSASAASAPGRLVLTSDMPATASVAGKRVGATPIRGLERPPGRYPVTFVSVELEEQVGTTVDLRPGQSVGVHAEFTRARPTVRVR